MEYWQFLKEFVHPENSEIACTSLSKNSIILPPVIDKEAICISATKTTKETLIALVEKDNPTNISFYISSDYKAWEKINVSFREGDNRNIESINLFLYKQELHLVYCTDYEECIIVKNQGDYEFKVISNLGNKITNASVYVEEDTLWLFYGKCLAQKLRKDLSEVYGAPAKLEFDMNTKSYGLDHTANYDGNNSPVVKKINGLYHLFFTDSTNRCYRESMDTYIAVSKDITGPYSRRYLVLPNGGRVSLFDGYDNEIYIAFIGSTQYSIVYNKPAILKLEQTKIGYLKPNTDYIYENTTIDQLLPIEGIEIRDPFVFLAPDDKYYLTGTTRREEGSFWKETNGIMIWKSDDLKNWESIGKVYDFMENPDNWQKNICQTQNTWAPEITYFNDTFWITYSPNPSCAVIKSITGKIEGPYVDMGRYVTNGIDSDFFTDDDGTVYFVYQNGKIAPLKKDGLGFAKDAVQLLPVDGQQVGYEGAGIIKIMGKYVLYAAEWNGDGRADGTYDMMYSVADNLYGPYSPRKLLIPHGGHGCLFKDKNNQIRFTMFGNDRTAPFRRSVGIGSINAKLENNELLLWI